MKAASDYRSDADTEIISNTFFSNDHPKRNPNNMVIRGDHLRESNENSDDNNDDGVPDTIDHPISSSRHGSSRSRSSSERSGSYSDSGSRSSITSNSDSDSGSRTESSGSDDRLSSSDDILSSSNYITSESEDQQIIITANADRQGRSNTIVRRVSPHRQPPIPKDSDQGVSRKYRLFHHGTSGIEQNSMGGGRGDSNRESGGRSRSRERMNPHHPHNGMDPEANSGAFRHALETVPSHDESDDGDGSTHSNRSAPEDSPSKQKVSWKSDPKDSFSDWKLEISYFDRTYREPRVDVYHLHKNMVAFGIRKSECILRDIQEVELREALHAQIPEINGRSRNKHRNSSGNDSSDGSKNEHKTHLDVPSESQARAVPMVLDFLYYTKETKHKLTADMACNIFKVAELLEVLALEKAIGDFYMKNLTLKNLGEFLSLATKAKADKLLTICKAKIGQMITEQPELSGLVPPKFMADILCISSQQLEEARILEPETYTEELIVSQSLYWSKAACICASANESILTGRLFQRLTSEDNLPFIDVSATPTLLSIESQFLGTGVVLEPTGKRQPTTATTSQKSSATSLASGNSDGHSRNEFTSLQRRCIKSIANDFETFQSCFDSPEALSETLRHLPSNFLAEILLQSRRQTKN